MINRIILILFCIPCMCFSQNQGAVWCFGDSALIDFSDTSNIVTGTSSVKSRGSCVSICDTTGQLLFYAYTRAATADNTTLVFSSNVQLMLDGDSIAMTKDTRVIPTT